MVPTRLQLFLIFFFIFSRINIRRDFAVQLVAAIDHARLVAHRTRHHHQRPQHLQRQQQQRELRTVPEADPTDWSQQLVSANEAERTVSTHSDAARITALACSTADGPASLVPAPGGKQTSFVASPSRR